MLKAPFSRNGFCPGNEQVFDLAITACVPVVILGSNKTVRVRQTVFRKSPFK